MQARSDFNSRQVTAFIGTLQAYRDEQKRINESEKLVQFLNARTSNYASGQLLANLPTAAGTNWIARAGVPGPPPAWVSQVHRSHADLRYGAGLVCCMRCGSVSSSEGGNSRLWKPYKGKIAEGSRGRLQKVKVGIHPHFGRKRDKVWPDGRNADLQVKFASFQRPEEILGNRIPVLQQRFYSHTPFAELPVTPEEQLVISIILDNLLQQYEDDTEEELKFDAAFETQLSLERTSTAITAWLNSTVWTEAIDRLLERSFEFEVTLSNEGTG